MKLIVPDLKAENVLSLLPLLPSSIPGSKFEVDFSRMSHIDPLAMLLFGSALKNYRSAHGESVFNAVGFTGKTYAGTMGLFKYISPKINYGNSPGEASGSCRYIPITCLRPKAIQERKAFEGQFLEVGDVIEQETRRLASVVSPNDANLAGLLTYLLRELIRNVPEHAQAEEVWVCGQYWPSKSIAEIAVLDEGIGIRASLSKNSDHRDYITSDSDALRWAIKPGVSQSFSPSKKPRKLDSWSNSGFGLYIANQIAQQLHGAFYLVSGDRYLRSDRIENSVRETRFKGTAIGIRLKTNISSDWNEVLKNAVHTGEEEAKNIRGAFKRASRPSRGLID